MLERYSRVGIEQHAPSSHEHGNVGGVVGNGAEVEQRHTHGDGLHQRQSEDQVHAREARGSVRVTRRCRDL